MKRCADCCDGTVTRFSTCGARLRGYSCFRLPHFGSVLNCQYRSIQVQVSIFQLSTIAALYKKRPRGVQRGAALCPFAVFSHSNVKYLCGFPQPMHMHSQVPAYSRNPRGNYLPIQNLENISLTRSSPSDSPRIRPKLSYASVRSIE